RDSGPRHPVRHERIALPCAGVAGAALRPRNAALVDEQRRVLPVRVAVDEADRVDRRARGLEADRLREAAVVAQDFEAQVEAAVSNGKAAGVSVLEVVPLK